MYKVLHVSDIDAPTHANRVQDALDAIGEGDIYSVQHSCGVAKAQYGEEFVFSTLIVYRIYEGN